MLICILESHYTVHKTAPKINTKKKKKKQNSQPFSDSRALGFFQATGTPTQTRSF